MKRLIASFFVLNMIFLAATCTSVQAQQPVTSEKQDLITKFRKLTGADNVRLNINASFEDIKNDLIATVDSDKELTDAQKEKLRRSAIEAYDRLDKQLKDLLNDEPQITKISEAAVFQVYDRAFSDSELREMIAFYSTPTGRKALQFLPTLSAEGSKAFQAMLLPKIQEFIAPKIKAESDQLKQKVQETKTKSP